MYIQYTMDPLYLPDDRIFASAKPGGGRDSYHPKMADLLKKAANDQNRSHRGVRITS